MLQYLLITQRIISLTSWDLVEWEWQAELATRNQNDHIHFKGGRKIKAVQLIQKLIIPSHKSATIKIAINNNSLHWHFLFHCLTVTGRAEFLFLTDLQAEGNVTAGTIQLACE